MTSLPQDVDNHAAIVSPLSPTHDSGAAAGHEGRGSVSLLRTRERRAGRDDFPVNGHPRRQTVSVVIPAMNEEHNIGWVLERMPSIVDEVILVDGHSSDRTVEVARAVRPDLVVVPQRYRGKGDAVRVAFGAASCDLVVMIDADGSMEPSEIDRFVTPLLNGYDFVKGSRFLAGGGSSDLTLIRKLGNQLLVRMTNTMFLVHFTDLCYGYCSVRRECLPALALTSHGFEIETELVVHALKADLRIAEVPSNELPRRCGTSNLHAFRDGKRVLRTLLRERFVRRPRPVVDPIDQRVLQLWRPAAAQSPGGGAPREALSEGTL
ncbi:Glycosyltransferase involved in cell wall bisynthesis [Micromonospora pattaloongensis]|uniref:Glycosyltransferase involved in cell wall bisynthesis n=1 Tax=Micromonospora pattaloongensis TaxID=405436 RepID=A0A1H3NV61_9ACTN|nr:glycosyltransferase family 2 protein [Micromonospora pattaloongensis]SDY92797.1 Glycosyltransferase involved in cell wall bisynthesis [Micromonospora pattaloongensis]